MVKVLIFQDLIDFYLNPKENYQKTDKNFSVCEKNWIFLFKKWEKSKKKTLCKVIGFSAKYWPIESKNKVSRKSHKRSSFTITFVYLIAPLSDNLFCAIFRLLFTH